MTGSAVVAAAAAVAGRAAQQLTCPQEVRVGGTDCAELREVCAPFGGLLAAEFAGDVQSFACDECSGGRFVTVEEDASTDGLSLASQLATAGVMWGFAVLILIGSVIVTCRRYRKLIAPDKEELKSHGCCYNMFADHILVRFFASLCMTCNSRGLATLIRSVGDLVLAFAITVTFESPEAVESVSQSTCFYVINCIPGVCQQLETSTSQTAFSTFSDDPISVVISSVKVYLAREPFDIAVAHAFRTARATDYLSDDIVIGSAIALCSLLTLFFAMNQAFAAASGAVSAPELFIRYGFVFILALVVELVTTPFKYCVKKCFRKARDSELIEDLAAGKSLSEFGERNSHDGGDP